MLSIMELLSTSIIEGEIMLQRRKNAQLELSLSLEKEKTVSSTFLLNILH